MLQVSLGPGILLWSWGDRSWCCGLGFWPNGVSTAKKSFIKSTAALSIVGLYQRTQAFPWGRRMCRAIPRGVWSLGQTTLCGSPVCLPPSPGTSWAPGGSHHPLAWSQCAAERQAAASCLVSAPSQKAGCSLLSSLAQGPSNCGAQGTCPDSPYPRDGSEDVDELLHGDLLRHVACVALLRL